MSNTKLNITEKKYLIKRSEAIYRDAISKKEREIFKGKSSYSPESVSRIDIYENLKNGKLKPFNKEEFIKQYDNVCSGKIYPEITNFIHGYNELIEKKKTEFNIKKEKLDKIVKTLSAKLQSIKDEIMLGTSKEYALKLLKTLEDVK